MADKEKKGSWNVVAFCLLASCFVLWGVSNGFSLHIRAIYDRAFMLTAADSWVHFWAYFGGYLLAALPTALFVRKHTYRTGVLVGLTIYVATTLLFYPFSITGAYTPLVLLAFLTGCALSFLETAATPYVMTMGDSSRSMFRLNLAQAYNTIGWFIGSYFIMAMVGDLFSPFTAEQRANLSADYFESMKLFDLQILGTVFIVMSFFIALVALWMALTSRMPENDAWGKHMHSSLKHVLSKLVRSNTYVLGIIALVFYVAAQTVCWSSINTYCTNVIAVANDFSVSQASFFAREYLLYAILLFGIMRFACSFAVLKVEAYKILIIMSGLALAVSTVALLADGMIEVYSLVIVSGCMSLMWPTIFCYALSGKDIDETKIGAAGLIMSIALGNSLPFLQGVLQQVKSKGATVEVIEPFYLLVISFGVILLYGLYISRKAVNPKSGK